MRQSKHAAFYILGLSAFLSVAFVIIAIGVPDFHLEQAKVEAASYTTLNVAAFSASPTLQATLNANGGAITESSGVISGAGNLAVNSAGSGIITKYWSLARFTHRFIDRWRANVASDS